MKPFPSRPGACRLQCRSLRIEALEDRSLLSLLGITPQFPVIVYNSTGRINYSAAAHAFDLTATPLRFKEIAAGPLRLITGTPDLQLHIQVDNNGQLLAGAPGSDLVINGNIDINGDGTTDVSGTLLTGTVSQFGFLDSGSTTDTFDFRFTPTGGALQNYFVGRDIGFQASSEHSTFQGSFVADFTGGAKGNIGVLPPLLSSLSGYVYADSNNNGLFETGETGISGATVTLTGTNVDGDTVNTPVVTDSTGAYSFANLRPGTYTIAETQPSGYLDGKDTIGTPGGAADDDVFSNLVLAAGVHGQDNNFGEVLPASLAGFVYHDADNDGIKQSNETGIATTVTLTGTDDLGQAANISTSSNSVTGAYSFDNLRPGTYTITHTQPSGYIEGKNTVGTPGGVTGNHQFSQIVLSGGVNGTQNNFGERGPFQKVLSKRMLIYPQAPKTSAAPAMRTAPAAKAKPAAVAPKVTTGAKTAATAPAAKTKATPPKTTTAALSAVGTRLIR